MVVGLTSSSSSGMRITQSITRDLWTFCALFVKLDAMEETSFWIPWICLLSCVSRTTHEMPSMFKIVHIVVGSFVHRQLILFLEN